MSSCVLDASALCALLFNEPGCEEVLDCLADAYLSTVNLTEVLTKAVDYNKAWQPSLEFIVALPLRVIPFDAEQAAVAASIRGATKDFGLSLGDRCCLALGMVRGLPVVTGDRDWTKANLGVDIRVFR